MEKLKFSKATNKAKLKHLGYNNIYTFSLPSGYSCPFAGDCLSKSDRITGKITDGKNTLYRCFSASNEARSKQAREQRWYNFDLLRSLDYDSMVNLITDSIPDNCEVLRIHVGGDMFNQTYFDAWLQVARVYPNIKFYAYTKSLKYWTNRINDIPDNLTLNASRGSRVDYLIDEYNLKTAEVVFSPADAEKKNLEIDHDDSHALSGKDSFALLLHGTQPKDSIASKALSTMRQDNIQFGYNRKLQGVAQ